MSELQIIANKSAGRKLWRTDNKFISYNFNHNKERYLEGKHYFLLQGNDLKAFYEIHDLFSNFNKVYLWIKREAFLHAKSFNTDKVCEVYNSLVNEDNRTKSYFLFKGRKKYITRQYNECVYVEDRNNEKSKEESNIHRM